MTFDAEQALQPELGHGERLIWSGVPAQGLRLRAADALMIPFSLFWAGFAFFWEYEAVTNPRSPFFFELFGIPFVVMGLYILVGRVYVDQYQRTRTFYGLTNQRVIILSGLTGRQVNSLSLQGLSDISLREGSGGGGTILLGPPGPYGMMIPSGWPGANRRAAPALELADEARRIYELIREAQRSALAPPRAA